MDLVGSELRSPSRRTPFLGPFNSLFPSARLFASLGISNLLDISRRNRCSHFFLVHYGLGRVFDWGVLSLVCIVVVLFIT